MEFMNLLLEECNLLENGEIYCKLIIRKNKKNNLNQKKLKNLLNQLKMKRHWLVFK
jgi:hypothetical protein